MALPKYKIIRIFARMKARTLLFFFLVLGCFLIAGDLAAQGCSQCRMVPASDLENGGSIGKGINTGILYMLAIPYIILALIFRKQIHTVYLRIRARKN